MTEFGKTLVIIGIIFAIAGLVLTFGSKIPYIGRLPGDIRIEKDNFKFYFPITTSIIISILLSIILNLFNKK